VALHEARDRRRHVHVAEQHRRGDREAAFGLARLGLQREVGGVGRQQHIARGGQVVAALLGQRQPSRGAMEQPHAEVRLERGERAHHRGQRAAERLRGAGQAALVGNLHEGLHGLEAIHRAIRSDSSEKRSSQIR